MLSVFINGEHFLSLFRHFVNFNHISQNITEPSRYNKNRRRPERWRSAFGTSLRPVVPLVPFDKGTAVAGATAGVRKRFFDGCTAVSLRCQRNGGTF